MPSESDQHMDEILKACAQRRRQAAGPPMEMPLVTRNLLQAEVARTYPQASAAVKSPRSGFAWWWPRLAWGSGFCIVLALLTFIVIHQPAIQEARPSNKKITLSDRDAIAEPTAAQNLREHNVPVDRRGIAVPPSTVKNQPVSPAQSSAPPKSTVKLGTTLQRQAEADAGRAMESADKKANEEQMSKNVERSKAASGKPPATTPVNAANAPSRNAMRPEMMRRYGLMMPAKPAPAPGPQTVAEQRANRSTKQSSIDANVGLPAPVVASASAASNGEKESVKGGGNGDAPSSSLNHRLATGMASTPDRLSEALTKSETTLTNRSQLALNGSRGIAPTGASVTDRMNTALTATPNPVPQQSEFRPTTPTPGEFGTSLGRPTPPMVQLASPPPARVVSPEQPSLKPTQGYYYTMSDASQSTVQQQVQSAGVAGMGGNSARWHFVRERSVPANVEAKPTLTAARGAERLAAAKQKDLNTVVPQVLTTFDLERVGNQVIIRDQDRSTYAGNITAATEELVRKQVAGKTVQYRGEPTARMRRQTSTTAANLTFAPTSERFTLLATGTNRSLNQKVEIQGQLTTYSTTHGMSNLAGRAMAEQQQPATITAGTVLVPSAYPNARLQGRIMIGSNAPVAIDAITVKPQ